MQRQPEPRRVRLTDQALVAVSLAREVAALRRDAPTIADVLVGLAMEPEGSAGRALRPQANAVSALHARCAGPLPALPPMDVALTWAAHDAAPRPVGTMDLLAVAVEAGGTNVAELLDACGLTVAVANVGERGHDWADPSTETFRLDPDDARFEPAAARAVARTRAVAGGPLTLLFMLAFTDDDLGLDPDVLCEKRDRVEGLPDGDLDVVVAAAVDGRIDGGPVSSVDLVRAALLVGGEASRRLLAETSR